jgi:hypothetical protein
MSNSLKKLIREAFNTAYKIHKDKTINESVDRMKASMSSGDIAKAEQAFREIKANPNLALQYAWTPQGSANGKLNPKEFNLLLELVYEQTDLEMKRLIFMGLYNDKNPALINLLTNRIIGLKGIYTNKQQAMQAVEAAWNSMFLGEKTKKAKETGTEQTYRGFTEAVNDYVSSGDSNFGAFLLSKLTGFAVNYYRDEIMGKQTTVSLDAPSTKTGKPRDISDETGEDFGSDTLNAPDAGETIKNFGAGVDDAEEDNGPAIDIDEPEITSDEDGEYNPGEEENSNTLGGDLEGSLGDEDSSPAEKHARAMLRKLVIALKKGFADFRAHEKVTPKQEQAMRAIELMLNTGKSVEEVGKELGINVTSAIFDLKKSKKFLDIIDTLLYEEGFLDNRGRVQSFVNIRPLYIAKVAKYLKTGDLSVLQGLDEGVLTFMDNLLFERFYKDNLDKIMENVYKRLQKNL